jgi:hypothetical protein
MFVQVSDSKVVNADHVIKADYQPKEGNEPSRLKLTLTKAEGSETIVVQSEWVARTWARLCSQVK